MTQARRGGTIHNEFTVVYEKGDGWYIGSCLEIPGANGPDKTKEECRSDLACAIALILKDRHEDGMRSIPYGLRPETTVLPDALPDGEYTIV